MTWDTIADGPRHWNKTRTQWMADFSVCIRKQATVWSMNGRLYLYGAFGDGGDAQDDNEVDGDRT
eukprot:8098887-Prorocentrum_lima.AAC.1